MSPITPSLLHGAKRDNTSAKAEEEVQVISPPVPASGSLAPPAPASGSSAPACGSSDTASGFGLRNGLFSPFTPKLLGDVDAAAEAPSKEIPRIIKLNVGGVIFQTAAS